MSPRTVLPLPSPARQQQRAEPSPKGNVNVGINSAVPRKAWMALQALGWQWCEPRREKTQERARAQLCVTGHWEMWPYNMGRAAGEDRGMCWLGDLAWDQEHC